ncbi:hypothetical protein HDV05_007225, partial [Chytridiales sp. JEL 0842]
NNGSDAQTAADLRAKERKKMKIASLPEVTRPHFKSVALKAPFIRKAVSETILPGPSVNQLILFDREICTGAPPGTVQPEQMREISFLDYQKRTSTVFQLEPYGTAVKSIDDLRLRKLALDILQVIPDDAGVRLGYCQRADGDMVHLLNLLENYANAENKNRRFPIQRHIFIDYQRELIMKIFADDTQNSIDNPETAIYAVDHKLGTLSKRFWKTSSEEMEMELEVIVPPRNPVAKSELDNAHLWHLIRHVTKAFQSQ